MSRGDEQTNQLLRKAQDALRQKDLEGARVLLNMVLARDPENADAKRFMRFCQVGERPPGSIGNTAPNRLARARELHGSEDPRQRRTGPFPVKRPASSAAAAGADQIAAQIDKLMEDARGAYTSRQYQMCLDLCSRVLERDPDHEEAKRYVRFAEVGIRSSSAAGPGDDVRPREARKTVQLQAAKVLKPRKRK